MKQAELIVALDVPDLASVLRAVDTLGDAVSFYKVGLELFSAEGPLPVIKLRERGKRVFLDLKLHDIPRTVEHAVASAARHGVELLTVHAGGGEGMLRAAAEAAAGADSPRPRIVAVTVLTSLAAVDLRQVGVSRELGDHALSLAQLAMDFGLDGLVCSALEVRRLREELGEEPVLVVPGIRPAGADAGDQKRVATPASAVADGATYLVVGRPILGASDPRAAAEAILAEMGRDHGSTA